MVSQVAESIEVQLQESLGGIVQEEIQREMAHGDVTVPVEERETMETVLRKWRDGHYDELKKNGELEMFDRRADDSSSSSSLLHSHSQEHSSRTPEETEVCGVL